MRLAAASIVAKVTRDRIMANYAVDYPGYGWETNRGYPTPQHIRAIETLGITVASGTVLDHLHVIAPSDARRRLGIGEP